MVVDVCADSRKVSGFNATGKTQNTAWVPSNVHFAYLHYMHLFMIHASPASSPISALHESDEHDVIVTDHETHFLALIGRSQ